MVWPAAHAHTKEKQKEILLREKYREDNKEESPESYW